MEECEWKRDTEQFKFKSVYYLKCYPIDIELLMDCDSVDCKTERAVHGIIMVEGKLYKKFTEEVEGKNIHEARITMVIKAMEVADKLIFKKENNADYYTVLHSLSSILGTVLKDHKEPDVDSVIESQSVLDAGYSMW